MNMLKSCRLLMVLLLGHVIFLTPVKETKAQIDGASQCALGLALLLEGNETPVSQLEAGFTNREDGSFDGKVHLLGNCAFYVGLFRGAENDWGGALEAYDVALDAFRIAPVPEFEGITLNNMGEIHRVQGIYDDALHYYEQALTIRRQNIDPKGEGITLNNIGLVYFAQGRYAKALITFLQALDLRTEADDQSGRGTTLNNIGQVYLVQGRYDEALEIFEEALVIMEDISNEVGRGVVLTSIGEVHRFREQYDKALSYYQQALEIMRVEEDIPKEAIALNNIAFAYKSLEEYDKAIEHYKQAIILMKTVNDPYGAGAALSNICAVYLELGFYQEALNNCQKALGFASEIGDNIGKGVALNNIASVYKAQGEPEEALRYYEQAITTLESVRAVSGSDIGRAGFISYFISVYNNAIQLYYQQNQSELAFLTSERGRARSFLDSLGTGEVLLDDANIHEEQLEELQKITILELLEVQNLLLDERTTLLSYWILGEEGALAFVITHDDLTVVELPEATTENLQKALVIESTGETTIELSDWLRQNVHNPHPLQLRNLHAWLVAPLAEHLNTPLVGIIPHQLLHYVPFAALTDGESYFGQQYTLFTLPSASALRFIKENAGDLQESNQPPFVVGNPDTNGRLPPLPYAAAEATAVASLLNAPIYTTAEASETQLRDSISGAPVVHLAAHGEYNVFNQYYSAIHLAQPSSSQEEVLTENEDGRLEVHEIYGLDLRSAELVVLSACQTNIGEITQANRVISAGDEIVGLTRAFFFAGTPTVISSLWSVDDAATEKLMVAFYYNWLEEGLSKAEALQAAQAHLRTLDGGRYASPFYWAGFVLNGDGGVYTGVVPTVPSTAAASTPTSETVAELAQETAEQPVKLEDGQEDSESSRGIYYSAVILVILLVIILTGFRRGKRHGSLL